MSKRREPSEARLEASVAKKIEDAASSKERRIIYLIVVLSCWGVRTHSNFSHSV
jgi:hypothetical protein